MWGGRSCPQPPFGRDRTIAALLGQRESRLRAILPAPPEALFALARTAFCAYRAATQSFTSDEAFSYNEFVSGSWGRIYARYDANNHVLYSILAKVSMGAFGVNEFALRLPSVLSGFFLMLGIYYVLEQTVSSRAVPWIALIALGLHPLLLDFSVAARGYGLSLALFVWAIYFFLRSRDILSGALAGLATAANLTLLYPAAGLVVCPLLLRSGDIETRIQGSLRLAFTLMAVFGAICYEALAKATLERFYAGTGSLGGAVSSLVVASIRSSDRGLGVFGSLKGVHAIQWVALPAVALFVWGKSLTLWRGPAWAPLTMLTAAIAGQIATPYLFGLKYPVDRTGLYLVVLFGLAWAIAASSTTRWICGANGLLAGLLVLQFVTQLQTRSFQVWQYDSGAKEVAHRIREESRGKSPASIKIGATWWLQPALEFYRQRYDIAALQPVQRFEVTPLAGFDYYVLDLRDDRTIHDGDVKRLQPLLSEPAAGVLLAKEP